MQIRKGETRQEYIVHQPWDKFLYRGVTGTNGRQIESKKGKKMMGSTVIGTP